jgi:stearoyl-CoA desaturase (delta-9 desaturase)
MSSATALYGRKASQGIINWVTITAMSAFHIGAAAALFFIDTGAMLTALVLYVVGGMLGIGMGYHRLLTHRGYRTPRWVEYALTVCGTLALEGGPIFWVATHRIHHQHSDKEGDPHTPREGTFWAHMGWVFMGRAMHHDTEVLRRYVPDLSRNRFHVVLTTWHWVPQVVLGLMLLALGGIPYVLWGVFVRTTVGLHATWLVNSATHVWGSRRFQTRDDSTNNWWVALLTFGEGWHNNHHAHPVSARHGLAWYELDLNWLGIRTLQALGLAWDVKTARLTEKGPAPQPAHTTLGLRDTQPALAE